MLLFYRKHGNIFKCIPGYEFRSIRHYSCVFNLLLWLWWHVRDQIIITHKEGCVISAQLYVSYILVYIYVGSDVVNCVIEEIKDPQRHVLINAEY